MDERGLKTNEYLINSRIDLRTLNLFFMFIYSSFFCLTFMGVISKGIILYFLLAGWFITSLEIDKAWLNERIAFNMCFIGYILLIITDSILTNNFYGIDRFLRKDVYFFSFIFIGLFYIKNFPIFNFKKVLKLLILCLLISYIATFIGLLIYPSSSRDLASSGIYEMNEIYQKMGIGGFGYINQIIYLVILGVFICDKKTWKTNAFAILSLLLLFMVVFKANYTTALILTLLAFIIALLMKCKNRYVMGIIAAVMLIVIYAYRVEIVEYALRNVFADISSTFNYRLNELLNAMINDSFEDLDRVNRIQITLEKFFKNPVWGQIGYPEKIIGGHSDIVDNLGKFGMLGFMYNGIYISFEYYLFKTLKTSKFKTCCLLIYVFMFISRVTNPKTSAFVLFVFCPIIIKYFDEKLYQKSIDKVI